ncbi:MAG: antitoxin [Acidiphilium sp.]
MPAAFRFEGLEAFIRRDPATGGVVLSSRPPDWDGFFAAPRDAEVPGDFLSADERQQAAP